MARTIQLIITSKNGDSLESFIMTFKKVIEEMKDANDQPINKVDITEMDRFNPPN